MRRGNLAARARKLEGRHFPIDREEALQAAAAILAEMADVIPAELIPAVRTALAVAYLEGARPGRSR